MRICLEWADWLQEMKGEKECYPMIMITKSEEEYIMEEAIGSKIAN
jgi:hypothetical protein